MKTTESRLLVIKSVNKNKMKKYSLKKYDENMMFFNMSYRVSRFPHDYTVPGIDHCYNCTAEIKVWEKYFEKFYKIIDREKLMERVSKTILICNKKLHKCKTLEKPNCV